MRYQPTAQAGWGGVRDAGLPAPLDCESRTMLRIFLAPIFETGESWQQIAGTLRAKGYALSFREGHLVVLDDRDRALCTGSDLGVPMAAISARIGRPCVVARADGHAGDLRPV